MKWMSELLMPASRGRSSKLHDLGLAKIVQGGYGLWNPNDETLILLPEGKILFQGAEDFLLRSLEAFRPQRLDCSTSARGALDAAVRLVRRAGDLPVCFAERRHDKLCLLGLHSDFEASLEMANDALRTVGSAVCSLGVRLRRVDRLTSEGHRVDLFCRSEAPFHGEEGLICPDCAWMAAFDSPCRFGEEAPDAAPEELREVATPECSTVEKLCEYLKITPPRIVKCMFYAVEGHGLAAVILRADRQVCLEKVRAAFQGVSVRPAEPAELTAVMGESAGYMGPVALPASVTLLADFSAVGIKNAVVGANKPGFHKAGACWGRDFKTDFVADVTLLQEGDHCPHCGASLKKSELRRIAVFRPVDPDGLAEPSLTFFNGSGKAHVPAWSAEIDLTALLSAVAESSERWPDEIAPFDVYVYWEGNETPDALVPLVDALEGAGLRVVVDDRGGAFENRRAEAAAIRAPQSVCLKKDESGWLLDVTRDGCTETLPPAQFAAQQQEIFSVSERHPFRT